MSSPGALAVSSGASSSGTLVPDKGRLKGRRSGGFPRSSDAHWSDGQRRRRSAAEHSIPSIISWPTYPPKSITVWGYAECLVPQRLTRGQYVLTVFMGPELLFLRLSATLERRVWLRFVSRWMANTASASAAFTAMMRRPTASVSASETKTNGGVITTSPSTAGSRTSRQPHMAMSKAPEVADDHRLATATFRGRTRSTRRPIHDVEVWELAASLSLLTHHAAVRPGVGVDGMLAAVRREP